MIPLRHCILSATSTIEMHNELNIALGFEESTETRMAPIQQMLQAICCKGETMISENGMLLFATLYLEHL